MRHKRSYSVMGTHPGDFDRGDGYVPGPNELRELIRQERDRAAREALRARLESENDIDTVTPLMAPEPLLDSGTARNKRWRRKRGECVGCGGAAGDSTPGCANCCARHGMRAVYDRQRSAA